VAANRDDAVSVFTRNPATNELAWHSAVRAADLAPLILEGPLSLTISPDGGHVYVAADNGLSVFKRETGGNLTFVEIHRDGEGGLTTLANPQDVVVSPDNNHVYVTARDDHSQRSRGQPGRDAGLRHRLRRQRGRDLLPL